MRKHVINFSKVTFLLLILFCVISLTYIFSGTHIVSAATENNYENLAETCADYTNDEFLFKEAKLESNKIVYYENYVNNRFDVENKYNPNSNITDEWILKIVPPELFEEKVEDFLYIGKTYGFYVDYNISDNTFIVYLMLHFDDDNLSGQYIRKIKPLYYERYTFNSITKKASLIYRTVINRMYYEKYSDVKKLYLKDVSFTGHLSNEMQLNQGEEGYINENDYGGYFYGNYYKFKGVSTQSGKLDFFAQIFKTIIGYIPLPLGMSVGDAFAVADIANSINQLSNDLKRDFRGEITNENNYGFEFVEYSADKQIDTYGHLLKTGGAIMETDNSQNAVLFGIRNDCYIQNTFFIVSRNQDNYWNTRFSGKVELDIVEEVEGLEDSTVIDIATGVESLEYIKSFDNGEKTKIQESEQQTIYILDDAKHHIQFQAPVSGTYTFKTIGNIPNNISDTKGVKSNIDNGVNKQLKIDLEQNEILDFYITKNNKFSSATFDVLIEFTPNEIDIGETKQIEINPGGHDYLLFRAENKATPFEFDIGAQDEVSLQFAFNKYENYLPNIISGNHLFGSRLAEFEGKYYFKVSNTSDSAQTVSVSLSNITAVSPEENLSDEIIDVKVYELSSAFTSGVNIAIESDAPILMQVFDSNHNLLKWTSNASDKTLLCSTEANKKYFLVLKSLLYTPKSLTLSFKINAFNLNLGNNVITKNANQVLTKFSTGDTRASYQIQCDVDFTVYDTNWQIVEKTTTNEYQFDANSIYYVNIVGSENTFDIDVNFIQSNATSGAFPASGMVLIKYVPTRTTAYKVNGASQVEWYNASLRRSNAYLESGNTYYLKLEGAPGEQYNVSIVRNVNRIQLNVGMNIGEGLYFFNISEAGNYTLWVNCPETMNTSLTITDGFGNVVRNEMSIVNEFVIINFESGLYYIDLQLINGDKASIRLNKS